MMKKFLFTFAILLAATSLFVSNTNAQEVLQNQVTTAKAKVLEVLNVIEKDIGGNDSTITVQTLQAEITDGSNDGKIVTFDNDYVMLEKGDTFYISYVIEPGGKEFYMVDEPDRTPTLIFFALLFVVLVIIFGGIQGLRGLLSLAGSLLVIIFVLLPGILEGHSPLLVSIGVASLIVILGSYITHGFNKTTSSAVFGMIITVIVTGIMAYFAVYGSHLSGITDDEAIFLNYNTQGGIDLIGLLMGGIIIGLLGVLYDVAIGQSISVEELHTVAPHLNRWTIYKRAVRIGREHIGALVNTLAIAYVGASLPLLLLFYGSAEVPFSVIVNREVFATEIIRILIGSIGLVLAVPITTLLAVLMLIKKEEQAPSVEVLKKEEEKIEHFNHTH